MSNSESMKAYGIQRTHIDRPVADLLGPQKAGDFETTIAMDGIVPLCFFALATPEARCSIQKCRVPYNQVSLVPTNVSNSRIYFRNTDKKFFESGRGLLFINLKSGNFPISYFIASMAHWPAIMDESLAGIVIHPYGKESKAFKLDQEIINLLKKRAEAFDPDISYQAPRLRLP
jgi:hypothetical protein